VKTLCTVALILTAATAAAAQAPTMSVVPADSMQWKEGPRSLPRGAQMMVLEGDPSQPGPFTIRFKFPDGFTIQPHWHTQTEHATVLAGVLHLGMGDTFHPGAMKALAAGSFGWWVAGTRHFARAEGETILQLHGMGPWTVQYVSAGDDPRRTRE
jgi:quercetin dioxygenase-like cupin family protein